MSKCTEPQTTTESATNRIDLESLSSALTASGWATQRTPKELRSIMDEIRAWRGPYRITVIADGCTYLGCTDTGYYNDPLVEVFHVDDALMHALDLIRHHTTPAPTVREQPEHAAAAMDDETGGQG